MRSLRAAMSRLRRNLACAAVLAALGLQACGPMEAPRQQRGNKIDLEDLTQLVVGTSTRADAVALVGSPTIRAAFDDNVWIYISSVTATRVGRTPGVLDQRVVVLNFNDQGVLAGIETRDKADALPVEVVTRTTPSPGSEASFLQQLLGNIGRFNALGSAPPGSTGSRGGAPTPF